MFMNASNAASNPRVKIKGVKFVKSFAGIDEYQLDNGLKILLKPKQDLPALSWQVWYKVGSRNEQLNRTGIAHYLEHIMFKGTETFAKGEIAQAIQLRGGVFNAFTSDDYTAYFENFAPENLELAIKIESDRMQNARIDHEDVELERSVIVSELEGNKNDPRRSLYETLRNAAFSVHTYRNPVIGYRDDLDNINSKNMREFYENYYYPDNAVAVLVGNFDIENALSLISKYFAKYKPKESKRDKVPQEPKQEALKQMTIRADGHLKMLAMAFHIPKFDHEDSAPLSLVSDIVFSGLTSRIYPKLVDAGLASSVSGISEPSSDAGLFRIVVNLNDDADIAAVEKIVDTELELIKRGATVAEIDLAKAREEASYVYERDGVYEEGLQIGYFEAITNDWTKYATWVDEIKKVTNEDIVRVAKEYFIESNKTVVYLLPEKARDALVELDEKEVTKTPDPLKTANYGAASVEPIDQKKLKHLLKITKPKYSKNTVSSKLELEFKNIEGDIDLHFREDHSLPLIYLNTNFFAGSFADEDKTGLAFFTAQLLERGSLLKDKYEIARQLDLYGASIDFEAGRESSTLEIATLSRYSAEVFALLKEILDKPAFSEEELERLKTSTIARLKQENEFPRTIASRELNRMIYPEGHPYYAYSVEERIKAVESIIIEDIMVFYKKHYNAKNLMVSVVGDLTETEAKALVYDNFKDWNKDGLDLNGNNRPEIALVDLTKAEEKVISMPEKKQTEINMGHACPIDRLHPDFYPLLIANYALGGSSLSSRLGTAIRDDNGLVYNIRTSFAASLGAGAFKVVLGCNPANTRKAIDLTKEVIADFIKTGANQTELEVTKSYLIGSFAVRTLSSNESIAETMSQLQLFKLGDDYIDNYADRVNAITLEQVNEAVKKYIHPDQFKTVVVGP